MTAHPGAPGSAPHTGLDAADITVHFGAAPVLHDVSLTVEPGTITAIVGPNGSGKSTLLRALGRLRAPNSGQVCLDGRDISRYPSRDLARRLGILPQAPSAPDGLTVIDLVSRGRDPHRRWFDQWARSDEAVVFEALARTDLTELAHARIDNLSGGQRQRAWIAMALAQEATTLLLDEPTTFLDIAHQLDVLDLVQAMNTDHGVTVVMVLHDLTMAARYADRIVAMRDGRLMADGTPDAVITPGTLRNVFDIAASVIPDPVTGRPHVLPIARIPAQPTT